MDYVGQALIIMAKSIIPALLIILKAFGYITIGWGWILSIGLLMLAL